MDAADPWSLIASSQFVSLGTYRRNGEVVATPVWIAPDGDELVVTTERATGKVKRLRNDPRVTLRPCTRMGKVEPDAGAIAATARLARVDSRASRALAAKYGLQYRVFLAIERVIRRLQRRPGERVIIRIAQPARLGRVTAVG